MSREKMKKIKFPTMSYFSNKIKELRMKENLAAAKVEEALGLSRGSWSRYERSSVIPSLYVGHRIADFSALSLDELVGRNVDKGYITLMRFKHAKERIDPKEFEWVGF